MLTRDLMRPTLPVLLLFAAVNSAAAQDVPEGHSHHGEAFNEGPRQKAYLMEGTGDVHFPCTTQSELARKFVDQGVGQLHGFWYFEAERSFRQAAAIDPDCAIAYWGMAMSNIKNEKRGRGFIAKAMERLEGVTEREAMYIQGLNEYMNADIAGEKRKKMLRNRKYAKSYERIIYKYPDDIEAKAFLALQIWENRKLEPIQSYNATDALLKQVLEVNPMHPCHHYVIHLWDLEVPSKALGSAGKCGQSAPAIAHMWHMPGHIFSRLKRYQDAVWQQEASARVDHAHMIRDRVMPDQIHNFAHNNEWLARNLMNVGRMHDALELTKNMVELPRHPKYNTLRKKESAYYGRLRLYETLIRFELWDELVALSHTPYLEPTDVYAEEVKRLRYLGRAHFKLGEVEKAKEMLDQLVAMLQEEQSAEKPDDEKLSKEREARLRELQNAIGELNARLLISQGNYKNGFTLLNKHGHVVKTNLAQMFLEAGLYEEAEKVARAYLKTNQKELLPLAHLTEILWKSGKMEEAAQTFDELAAVAGQADLDAPVLTRLAPLAKELGKPADWRIRPEPLDDLGFRPPLDSLGPFRWHPYPAPDFALKDVGGEVHTLREYRGRPVMVIFYLGYGCLHCAEQLQAFAPKTNGFADAGISLIAISTDDEQKLKKSHENYKEGEFPFPLVSGADLDVFRKYRAYDDFENQTLHGTFLVDADGMVRWQDISYEPFMDPDFALKESKRLLAQRSTYPVALRDGKEERKQEEAKDNRPFRPGEHTTDSLETVKKLLKDNKAVLLDVREQAEWEAGHLEQATLVPLSELQKNGENGKFQEKLKKKVSKEKIVYCHCRSGGRVLPASQILFELGYDIRPLKAGYPDLVEAGFAQADAAD